MTDETAYTPPKVWTWNKENGGRFANINRPIAGPTHDKELPVGRHPLQLYSLATPNGVKVTVMLEELLALGPRGRGIRRLADQHRRGRSVRQRLRRREPELQDPGADGPQRADADPRVRVRRDPALPGREVRRLPAHRAGGARRVPVVAVLADGRAPYLGGGFGHFYAYAPDQDRIRHRPLRHGGEAAAGRARPAAGRERVPGRRAVHHRRHGGLALVRRARQGAASTTRASSCRCSEYKNVQRWTDAIAARPAVKRGRMVNRMFGDPASQLRERHDGERLRHQDAGQSCRGGVRDRSHHDFR